MVLPSSSCSIGRRRSQCGSHRQNYPSLLLLLLLRYYITITNQRRLCFVEAIIIIIIVIVVVVVVVVDVSICGGDSCMSTRYNSTFLGCPACRSACFGLSLLWCFQDEKFPVIVYADTGEHQSKDRTHHDPPKHLCGGHRGCDIGGESGEIAEPIA